MLTLYMVQLGGRPKGRLIEQHDIFFGAASQVSDLIGDINEHWPEVKNKWHIDSYRAIAKVGSYAIKLIEPSQQLKAAADLKLFFINLGGYQQDSFEEFHYKLLIANRLNRKLNIVDIDDIYNVNDLISNVQLSIEPISDTDELNAKEDKEYVGYLSIKNLKKLAL